MKRYRFRIVLSVLNLLLAALLFGIGRREFTSLASLPGAFYEGSVGYTPSAQKVSYCINAPALVVSAPIRHWVRGRVTIANMPIAYGDIEYGIAIFLFWWWLGSKIDIYAGDPGTKLRKPIKLAECIVILLLSFVLLYGGITGLSGKSMVGHSVLISMTFWGAGLLYCLAADIQRGARHRARPALSAEP